MTLVVCSEAGVTGSRESPQGPKSFPALMSLNCQDTVDVSQ